VTEKRTKKKAAKNKQLDFAEQEMKKNNYPKKQDYFLAYFTLDFCPPSQ
jgi:hypothetical protein